MTFKKILPWLAGIVVVIIAAAAYPLSRLLESGGRAMPVRRAAEEGLSRGPGGGPPAFSGPMMGGWGGRMGGLEMYIFAIFLAALFLFTVWAFLKIVRASSMQNAAPVRSCPACRRTAAPDWKICPYCGADLNAPPASPSEPGA